MPGAVSYFDVYADYWGFDLYWGDPVSTGGSPITGFVIQEYDYDSGSWFTLGYADPSWRHAYIDAPGYGCGDVSDRGDQRCGRRSVQRTSRGLLRGCRGSGRKVPQSLRPTVGAGGAVGGGVWCAGV